MSEIGGPYELEAQLLAAATSGDLDTVDRLLKAGVSADPTPVRTEDAETTAKRDARIAELETLVDGGFGIKAMRAKLEIQQLLKEAEDASPKKVKRTPLQAAAERGHVAIVDRLLRSPSIDVNNVNDNGSTALWFACSSGHLEIVKRLLQAPGLDVNAENTELPPESPLLIATRNKQTAIVECLLEVDKLEPHSREVRFEADAFMSAASDGNVDILKVMLASGRFNVNRVSGFEEVTALLLAARHDNTEALELLMKTPGTDLACVCSNGENAVMHAARHRDAPTDSLELLLVSGLFDVNRANKHGDTALHFAVGQRRTSLVERFLKCTDINLNARNKKGFTPLTQNATREVDDRLLKIMILLVESGADWSRISPADKRSLLEVSKDKVLVEAMKNNLECIQAEFIAYSDLKGVRQLSSGQFGITLAADLRINAHISVPVVLKVAKADAGADEWFELQTLQNLPQSRYVLNLLGICTDFRLDDKRSHETAIVLHFKAGGSLRDHLNARTTRLPYSRLTEFALYMARGVQHMHANGMIHNDIAARNFLLAQPETESGSEKPQCLVVADFGLARRAEQIELKPTVPWRWTAPEVLLSRGQCTSTKSDVWMYGIAVFEMFKTQWIPWQHIPDSAILASLYKANRVPLIQMIPTDCPHELRSIITECLSMDPASRPLIGDIAKRLEALHKELLESPRELGEEKAEQDEVGETLSDYDSADGYESLYATYDDLSEDNSSDSASAASSVEEQESEYNDAAHLSSASTSHALEVQEPAVESMSEASAPPKDLSLEEEIALLKKDNWLLRTENADVKAELAELRVQYALLESKLQ